MDSNQVISAWQPPRLIVSACISIYSKVPWYTLNIGIAVV